METRTLVAICAAAAALVCFVFGLALFSREAKKVSPRQGQRDSAVMILGLTVVAAGMVIALAAIVVLWQPRQSKPNA